MIILGAGGHAGVVIDAIRTMGIIPIGALNSVPGEVNGVPVIGDDDYIKAPHNLANGLGNRATRQNSGLDGRANIYQKFRNKGCTFMTVTHATAIVAESAYIGEGAQIMAGAVVQTGAVVGKNTILNTRSIVEHDCFIGDHSHIAPGAILCGSVLVGANVHIGAGAIVLQRLKIGDGAIIAAGAVVTKDVLAGECFGRQD
jgi:sugar O-acyltransferase (sialic acid O-acetyltransferase NeuD family)